MKIRTELVGIALLALALGSAAAWVWSGESEPAGDGSLRSLAAQPASGEVDESRRNAIVNAAERVGPSVVSVNVTATQVVRVRDPVFDRFFREFFPPRERLRRVEGLGSGFIVSPDGYILTNEHVVHGATETFVTLMDGRQLEAELIGADEVTDLAVLKVDAEDLPAAPLGDSRDLLIGEWVIAIGNPFGYLLADREPSVTVGVVSAIGRDVRPETGEERPQVWSNMIQTDAAINPGNSGGPLVNARGEVIGVNAFIFSGGSGGSIGLGFAIPIHRARRVLDDLVEYGSIRRPWIGIHLDRPPTRNGEIPVGVRVIRVDPRSPAARAGIEPGDVITETDGRPVQTPLEWEGRMLDMPSDRAITLTVERAGETFTVDVTPEDDPLRHAPRIETPFDAAVVVLDDRLASRLGVESDAGLLLQELGPRSPFRRLGFREGDVLVAIGQRRLDSADDVEVLVRELRSGGGFTLVYERDGRLARVAWR